MKKKHLKELERITASVPKELRDNVVKEVEMAPTVKKVLRLALESDGIDEKKKNRIRNLLESGKLDKKIYETNEDIEKQINEHLDREIEKSIKLGRLPKEDKAYKKKIEKLCKEQKK